MEVLPSSIGGGGRHVGHVRDLGDKAWFSNPESLSMKFFLP